MRVLHLVTDADGAMSRPVASHDRWGEPLTTEQGNVLLGIPDTNKATALAHAAQQAHLQPALAFTPAMLLDRLRFQPFDLVVIHPRLLEAAPSGRQFLDAVRAHGCPLLVLPPEPPTGTTTPRPTPQDPIGRAARLLPARTTTTTTTTTTTSTTTTTTSSSSSSSSQQGGCVSWGPLRLDLGRRQAWWGPAPLELTPAQFRIVVVLVSACGAVVTNHELARRVWGSEGHLDGERIFAHIRRIRKKIERDPTNPSFLLTVRGEGFRLAHWA